MTAAHDDTPPNENEPGVWHCRRGGEGTLMKFQREWDAEYDLPDNDGPEFGA